MEQLPRPARQRHSGVLLKVNIAPLMGRRDAAFDVAFEFSQNELNEALIGVISELLDAAAADTRSIIWMLSSPDTISREQHVLEHINTLLDLLRAVSGICRIDRSLLKNYGKSAAKNDSENSGISAAMLNDELLQSAREMLTKKIVECFQFSRGKFARYRAYAAKNSSASHAGRFARAYECYLQVYRDRQKVANDSVKGEK